MVHRERIAVFASLLCVVGVVAARTAAPGPAPVVLPRLPMEYHSINDVDMWPQALRKGVRWFKLDVDFCVEESCVGFSTFGASGNRSECFAAGNATYCCLCMRGDASSRPKLWEPFNTTDDMLAFLNDPSVQSLYFGDPATPVHFGLDFGNSPGLDLAADPAFPPLARFLLGLGAVANATKNAVQPYSDSGMGGLFDELDQRCAAGQCSPLQAAVQRLPFPSESGGGFPSARYQIYNADASGFESECAGGFAGNPSAVRFPYMFWEPSSQDEMTTIYAQWANCTSLPASQRNLNDNFTLVTNQGPEMVEVFGGTTVGRGHNDLILDNGLFERNFTQPRLALLGLDAAGAATANLPASLLSFTSVSDSVASGTVVFVHAWAPGGGPSASNLVQQLSLPTFGSSAPVDSFSGPILSAPSSVARGAPALLWAASSASARFALLAVANTTSAAPLRILSTGVLPTIPGETRPASIAARAVETVPTTSSSSSTTTTTTTTPLASTLVCDPVASSCVVLSLQGNTSVAGAGLAVAVHSFPGLQFLASVSVQTPLVVDAASVSVAWNETTGTWEGLLVYASRSAVSPSSETRSRLYGAGVRLNVSVAGSAHVDVLVPAGGVNNMAPIRLGFGSAPHVLVTTFQGITGAMLTHTDGVCQCGLLENNGDTPHCLIPDPSSDLNWFLRGYQTVSSLLNYNWGRLDRWWDVVQSVPDPSDPHAYLGQYLSQCHRTLLNGKFESGLSPSAAFYPRLVSYTNEQAMTPGAPRPPSLVRTELAAVFVHDGNVVAPITTTVVCGLPAYKNGVVFDEFHLVQPSELP